MREKEIALTDLIKQLGFDNRDEYFSKWVGGIIEKRENFKKKFVIEHEAQGRKNGRSQKTMVREDARIFVDNLCILMPYCIGFFGKNDKDDNDKNFPTYQKLKNGSNKNEILIKAQKVKKDLDFQKRLNENALKGLSKIVAVFNVNNKIDITTDSLRDMLNNVSMMIALCLG
ncbi:MAG: hypothetical protein Q8Q54_02925 [Methylococcales bacterium]|nr:hypothetical protein [Methylococcales bacterium]MDP3837855.1 hypothetical protein [Methylococcales bacterium]